MGTSVTPLPNGKFKLTSSCTDKTTRSLTRAQAILYFLNKLSPCDFIKEYFAFPDQWSTPEMRMLMNADGRKAYFAWMDSVKTDEEVYEKYLKCVEELREQAGGGK